MDERLAREDFDTAHEWAVAELKRLRDERDWDNHRAGATVLAALLNELGYEDVAKLWHEI